MNYGQIEAFLYVTRLGSISKAANALYVSQSTVSQRLQAIENEYNIKIIKRERGIKKISLTKEGEQFYKLAMKFESIEKEAESISTMSGTASVVIGAVDSVHNIVMLDIYKRILGNPQGIRLSILTHQSDEIYMLLDRREIDVGLTLQKRHMSNMVIDELFSEKLVMVTDKNYKFDSKVINNHHLSASKQILIHWGSEYRVWHEQYWGAISNTFLQVDTPKMLEELIDGTDLWAIVPISLANHLNEKGIVNIYELKSPPPNRICYLVTRNDAAEQVNIIKKLIFTEKNLLH